MGGFAIGAWLGGAAITAGFGWASTGWVGLSLALAGMAVFGLSVWQDRRMARESEPLTGHQARLS